MPTLGELTDGRLADEAEINLVEAMPHWTGCGAAMSRPPNLNEQ